MKTATYTVKEAMKLHSGTSSRTLQNMLLRGELQGKKVKNVWRIDANSLNKLFGGN